MEPGANGVTGLNVARLVELDCGHVSGSAILQSHRMVASRAMKRREWIPNSAGLRNAEEKVNSLMYFQLLS